jgi:uncharacterized membrane protein YcjF (UPF0283 family)
MPPETPPQRDVSGPEWLSDPNRPNHPGPRQNPDQPGGPGQAAQEPEGLGTPRQEATDARPINEAESLLKTAWEEYEKEPDIQFEEALKERGWSLAGLIKKTGLTNLVLALSALGLLVLATQALSFMAQLAALPLWGQYLGYGLGAVLVLLVLFCLGRFLAAYFSLEKSPRISVKALQELGRRSQLRQQAAGLLQEAKTRLIRFVQEYPLESEADKEKLTRLGFSQEAVELMAQNREQLLSSAKEEGCEAWLAQMDSRFVAILDQAARKRITRYAWMVGVKTAAAPTGFVDASIVLINAYRLMEDLCRIYRLRSGGIGTASILTRIFINAFAAARIEEWMDSATQHLMDTAAQGTDGMAAFFKVISGGVLSRAAEGGANAFLLVRLGAAGIHYLRPIAEKPGKKLK